MIARLLAALVLLVVGSIYSPVMAQDQILVVGTKEAPPFAIKQDDGSWRGISIALWERVAEDLDLSYTIRETDLAGLIRSIEEDSVDAAVAALTVTADREERMDFSHPFHTSGLSIAVPVERGGWLGVLWGFFSIDFLKVVGVLTLLLLVVGVAIWLAERKRNPEQFGGPPAKGIAAGFWWSAVTMTTVGYGDKAPKTAAGRLVGVVWMFAAIIIISGFTAAIASALTISRFTTTVADPGDLHEVRVGTVPNSTSAAYLASRGVAAQSYSTPEEALSALAAGELEAFVYDAPILQYYIQRDYRERLEVLPETFRPQYYGIAFPDGSDLVEPVNRALLDHIGRAEWREVLRQYLGETDR